MQTENDIDEIFRKAINPLDIQPSEGFWKRAAEDVISRANKTNDKKSSRWRLLAFIFAIGLLVLGYFTYRMQNGLESLVQQMAVMKKMQNFNTEKIMAEENAGKTALNMPGNAITLASTKPAPSTAIAVNNSASPTNHGNRVKSELNNQTLKKQFNRPNKIAGQEILTTNAESPKLSKSNKQELLANHIEDGKEISSTIVSKIDEIPFITDFDNTFLNMGNFPGKAPENQFSKFSISAFFSPGFMIAYKFSSNNSGENDLENDVKSGEKEKFSYSTGGKIEYALSSNFTLGEGLSYSSYSFSIALYKVYAQMESDGKAGYYMVTSSGVVDCPSYGKTGVGDSINVSATSSRTYLSIPVELKYYVTKNRNCRFYVHGGIETNISISQKTTMNWQDFWNQQGVAVIIGAEGTQPVYFSYNFGIGIEYKVGRAFSLYFEPVMQNAITGIDKNTPVVSYPMMGSLTLGMTYRFR